MTDPTPPLALARCGACHLHYLPNDGPCPKCGARRSEPYPVPPTGRVLAATELLVPPPGWTAPHRLVLAEVADGVRLLAVAGEVAFLPGDAVQITFDGGIYRAARTPRERGEGESPRTRPSEPSFEPPR